MRVRSLIIIPWMNFTMHDFDYREECHTFTQIVFQIPTQKRLKEWMKSFRKQIENKEQY